MIVDKLAHTLSVDYSCVVSDKATPGPSGTQPRGCGRYTGGMAGKKQRCGWAEGDPLYEAYHDHEWGVPEYDGRQLWAKLVLDGAQAGLSWITILRKREGYLSAFHGLDPVRVAAYGPAEVERLLADPGIIRNRQKIVSAIKNAQAYLEHFAGPPDFSAFLRNFVDGKPVRNRFRALDEIPAETERSQAMSKALKQRGLSFVGPTIVYAFMQAVGMVNDHLVSCPRHREVSCD
jgi:DNA-3-methyladenine glycosylase I